MMKITAYADRISVAPGAQFRPMTKTLVMTVGSVHPFPFRVSANRQVQLAPGSIQ